MKRNPYYTVINILGLAIALMFVILIGDYTWRQFSMDHSQPNKDRIVLLGRSSDYMSWPEESWKIGRMYPEIENTCCVVSQGGTIRTDEESFKDMEGNPVLLVDSTFFSMFSFDFVEEIPGTLCLPRTNASLPKASQMCCSRTWTQWEKLSG